MHNFNKLGKVTESTYTNTIPGLANCRYVAHQSDRQAQNAPKGYIGRQEMTPEIAHMYVNSL